MIAPDDQPLQAQSSISTSIRSAAEVGFIKPPGIPESIDKVEIMHIKGPWRTKSAGNLEVLFNMPAEFMRTLLTYDRRELSLLGRDIRGLRIYRIYGIPGGQTGGGEFHRIRRELLFAMTGLAELVCEDLYGGRRAFILDGQTGAYIPPYILHTYRTRTQAELLVVANTTFSPEDPWTHDTYAASAFSALKENVVRGR